MKKTILFFILFTISFMLQAQDQTSEYGVVFVSRIEARTESVQTVGIHSISFDNNYFSFHPNNSYTPIIRREDFFYIHQNLTTKGFDFIFNSNHRGCDISYVLSYDLNFNRSDSNQEVDFNGCFATTFPVFIHLPQPKPDNSRCIEDVIDLSSGWNWEYRYNGADWVAFPEEFQMSRDISFKMKDLPGFDGKTKIDFRTGYKTQFTKFITYNIIPCSPKVAGKIPELTSCIYTNDGAVIINLERKLVKGEDLVNMSLKNKDSVPIPIFFKEINASQFSLSNLAKGNYKFKYQTRMLINGVEANSTPVETTFAIDSPSPLQFSLSHSNPKCYTDKGNVTITATGGTPPYFYKIGNNTEIEFPKKTENGTTTYSNTVPILVEGGAHKIIVRDKNNCIEKLP
jgi:hypothetical protein